ncbi:MAG: hypothetical protein DMF61_13945 [Blastocatellia bacterium AA13]|nr:MAG: hypothetical protein DMF61_13945 [Blastocatellia bacterium AA13]
MRTLLEAADRESIMRRLAALTPNSPRKWGRLSMGEMLSHLHESTRMALGELPVKPKGKRVFQVFPLKHLLLYVVPFPKGAPTAPELLQGVPSDDFEIDKTRLRDLLTRLGLGPCEGLGPAHPLFGPLSRQEWGAATYKHTDHHLRQFGV